jgi:hypothetical protein
MTSSTSKLQASAISPSLGLVVLKTVTPLTIGKNNNQLESRVEVIRTMVLHDKALHQQRGCGRVHQLLEAAAEFDQ